MRNNIFFYKFYSYDLRASIISIFLVWGSDKKYTITKKNEDRPAVYK